jgi:hypothetical protein
MSNKSRRTEPASQPPSGNALALAIHDRNWERAALLLMLGVTQTMSMLPRQTIDDVIALLDSDGGHDGDR